MNRLIEIIENYVENDEITDSSSFKSNLNLSSLDIMCIIIDVEVYLGVRLKPTDFIAHKTVGEMFDFIKTLK